MQSLPLIVPRDDSTFAQHTSSVSWESSQQWTSSSHMQDAQRRQMNSVSPNNSIAQPSLLAQLTADENAIEQRKQNVRRFGAGWIRPPGIVKTYQAAMDELAEREEQELLARREQHLLELQEAQMAEEAGEGEEEDDEGERDLDDDVPEAEADTSVDSVSEEDDDEEDEEEDGEGGVTFNDQSFIEGSMLEPHDRHGEVQQMLDLEEAEMTGILQDERDLDDDIPEAGSYQHTDTELEDSSSEIDPEAYAELARPRQQMPSQAIDSSLISGSSFWESSPAHGRNAARGNTHQPSRGR